MPRRTRKQLTKGTKRAVGRDGRSSLSTTPYRRREGGLIVKRAR